MWPSGESHPPPPCNPQPVDPAALLAGMEPVLKVRLTHLTCGGSILALTLAHAVQGEGKPLAVCTRPLERPSRWHLTRFYQATAAKSPVIAMYVDLTHGRTGHPLLFHNGCPVQMATLPPCS